MVRRLVQQLQAHARVCALVVFLCAFPLLGVGQAGPQRDAQAVAVLTKSLNASGSVGAVLDFKGTGTIAYNWAGKSVVGSVAIQGKGPGQFRMDSNVSGQARSLIVNGHGGALVGSNGEKTPLPYRHALTASSMAMPGGIVELALTDKATTVVGGNLVRWNDTEAYCVHVEPSSEEAFRRDVIHPGLGVFELYIDPNSYQVVGLAERILAINDPRQPYLHEISFSTYTPTHNIALPFKITERINGQMTWSISLESLSLNTGVLDSLFTM